MASSRVPVSTQYLIRGIFCGVTDSGLPLVIHRTNPSTPLEEFTALSAPEQRSASNCFEAHCSQRHTFRFAGITRERERERERDTSANHFFSLPFFDHPEAPPPPSCPECPFSCFFRAGKVFFRFLMYVPIHCYVHVNFFSIKTFSIFLNVSMKTTFSGFRQRDSL